MTDKNETQRTLPLGVRIALCVALGTALTASNGGAVGIAVATGLWLALAFGSRGCKSSR
jgi:hypothetical protein